MSALLTAISPLNLIYMLVGTVLGILIGAAPGLGPVFALAILLPMTYSMSATSSVIFLSAVYGACCYGGSISAILLNTPGTPGNVATCFDGYPMTRKGEAGRALGISTVSSLVGGLFGVAAFALLGNALAQLSLKIGAAEYFLLAVAGLSLVALAAKGNALKGIIMGGLGLMLTFIGRSVVTGDKRFTFGTVYLEDGLQFIPIVIGAFALAQALILVNEKGAMSASDSKVSGVMAGTREVFKFPVPLIRSSVLGTIIGIVPGLGINAASFITYVVEKNAAKDKDTFGEGNTKGLIAPQTAIGAVTSSALIPAFALGVPGSSSAALFLSALSIHGIQTGYSFYSKNGDMVSTIIWGMLLAQFAFAILGLLGAKYFAKITEMPNSLLVPLILMLSVVGAYATRRQIMDVVVMLVAAVVGYCLERNKFPLSCLVLGLILGSLAEDNYCRAMRLSGNSWSIFITRPISLALIIVIVVCFAWPFLKKAFGKKNAEG
nr:tripartite tricarboxylate transporter permease [uncultured Oscillibacter sp.]